MTDTEIKPHPFTRSFIILSLCAVLALGVLIALGSWQVKRLHWKEALISKVEARIKQAPVQLADLTPVNPALKGSDEDLEYRAVKVTGTFDHEQEFFYYATLKGVPGFHVYTPLKLSGADEGSGKFVFINRGFVPDNKKTIKERPESITSGEVTLTGLFRWPDFDKPNSFIPDNDVKAGIFFWRDLTLMRTQAGLSAEQVHPFFIYADKKPNQTLPIGGVTIIDFPNSHLAYAITWYGLALTLIGVYGALLIGRMRGKG